MQASGCPHLTPLRVLTRKWSYLTLRSLRSPQGFSELKRGLRFITSRMLSRELSLLAEERLVEHKNDTYWLTPAGTALVRAAEPLMRWSVDHMGTRHCAPEQECARCVLYPEAMQGLVRVGR